MHPRFFSIVSNKWAFHDSFQDTSIYTIVASRTLKTSLSTIYPHWNITSPIRVGFYSKTITKPLLIFISPENIKISFFFGISIRYTVRARWMDFWDSWLEFCVPNNTSKDVGQGKKNQDSRWNEFLKIFWSFFLTILFRFLIFWIAPNTRAVWIQTRTILRGKNNEGWRSNEAGSDDYSVWG